MGKGYKKSRAAIVGTRADPRRDERVTEGVGARVGAGTPWLVAPLDEGSLSKREYLTRRIFTTVEVVLCLVALAVIASLSIATGGITSESLRLLFHQNPTAAVGLVAGCAQPFVAYLLRNVYQRYAVGDVGCVLGNLIVFACAELLLQSALGFVAVVVLLWRTYPRCSSALVPWARHRHVGGVLVDVSGGLVVLVLAGILFYAHARLTA